MPRYFVPLLWLLGLGALAVWLLLPPAKNSQSPPPLAQQAAAAETPPQQATPPAAPPTAEVPELTRQINEELPITPPVAEGMLVTVLHQGSEQPAANIDVYIQDIDLASDEEVLQEQAASWAPIERALTVLAKRYRTDASGKVRVPLLKRTGGVYVVGDQLLGMNPSVPANLSGCVIHVYPNPTLSVRVIDREGAVVPRALVIMRKDVSENVWSSRRTDSNGRCTVEYPMAIFAFMEMEEQLDPLGLDVAVLGGESRATFLPLDRLPEREQVLHMPEASRLRIRVTDAEGNPFPRLVTLSASLQDPMVSPTKEESLRPLTDFSLPMLPEMFPLEIGAVPRAGMVKISASTPDRVFSAETLIAAPSSAKETLEVTLRMTAAGSKLSFVVRNQEGKLGKRVKVEAMVSPRPEKQDRLHSYALQANDEGLVSMTLEEEMAGTMPQALQVVLPPRGKHPLRVATLPLPQPFVPGEFFLGDAVLLPAPVQLRGTVTDYQGKPIAMAGFNLRQQPTNPEDYWSMVQTYDCTTDAQGRFEMRGVNPPGIYRLETYRSGYRSDVQELRLAGQELSISLANNLKVTASILVDDHISSHDLKARLEYRSPNGSSSRRYARIAKDFSFSTEIAAGDSVRLLLLCARTDQEVYAQELTALPPAGGDYPVGEIDLRGKLMRYEVSVHQENGQGIEDVSLQFADGHSASISVDSFSMLSSKTSEDVAILANEYRSTQVTLRPGQQDVTLQPGIRVEIIVPEFAGTRKNERPQLTLRLQQGESFLTRSFVALDDSGRGHVTLSDPGTYAIFWQNIPQRGGGNGAVMIAVPERAEHGAILVKDLAGQSFQISPPEG